MEKLEGAELQVGYCIACGQARQFQTPGGWNSHSLMNGPQMNVNATKV